jgi:hypothetical protein
LPPKAEDFASAPEDEDEDSEDETADAAPQTASAAAAVPAPDDEAAGEPAEPDRWAGTLSHDWAEPGASRPDDPAMMRPKAPAKPRITVEEAVKLIPQEALEYMKNNFKTGIHRIRSYNPTGGAKQ